MKTKVCNSNYTFLLIFSHHQKAHLIWAKTKKNQEECVIGITQSPQNHCFFTHEITHLYEFYKTVDFV